MSHSSVVRSVYINHEAMKKVKKKKKRKKEREKKENREY